MVLQQSVPYGGGGTPGQRARPGPHYDARLHPPTHSIPRPFARPHPSATRLPPALSGRPSLSPRGVAAWQSSQTRRLLSSASQHHQRSHTRVYRPCATLYWASAHHPSPHRPYTRLHPHAHPTLSRSHRARALGSGPAPAVARLDPDGGLHRPPSACARRARPPSGELPVGSGLRPAPRPALSGPRSHSSPCLPASTHPCPARSAHRPVRPPACPAIFPPCKSRVHPAVPEHM